MIAEKFRHVHPQRISDDGEHEVIPVVMVQMPAVATVNRLQTALLVTLGTPVGFYGRNDVREALTLRLMRTVGVRMLIIDEIHNLLGATAIRQRELYVLLATIFAFLLFAWAYVMLILRFVATTSLRTSFIP